MKSKALRRIVSLTIIAGMSIAAIPFFNITKGYADTPVGISARINGLEEKSANTVEEIMQQHNISQVSSIEIKQGNITQADFTYLSDKASSFTNIITTNVPPEIADTTVFDSYPDGRKITIPTLRVDEFKSAADGNTSDNYWYGFEITVDDSLQIMETITENIISSAEATLTFPKKESIIEDASIANNETRYTVSTIWKNEVEENSNGVFANERYSAVLTFTANEGYKFDPNMPLVLTPKAESEYQANIENGVVSDNTITYRITFSKNEPPQDNQDTTLGQDSTDKNKDSLTANNDITTLEEDPAKRPTINGKPGLLPGEFGYVVTIINATSNVVSTVNGENTNEFAMEDGIDVKSVYVLKDSAQDGKINLSATDTNDKIFKRWEVKIDDVLVDAGFEPKSNPAILTLPNGELTAHKKVSINAVYATVINNIDLEAEYPVKNTQVPTVVVDPEPYKNIIRIAYDKQEAQSGQYTISDAKWIDVGGEAKNGLFGNPPYILEVTLSANEHDDFRFPRDKNKFLSNLKIEPFDKVSNKPLAYHIVTDYYDEKDGLQAIIKVTFGDYCDLQIQDPSITAFEEGIGDNFQVTANARCSKGGKIEYKWYFKPIGGKDFGVIQVPAGVTVIDNQATLSISPINRVHEGTYRLEAICKHEGYDEVTKVSSEVTLKVLDTSQPVIQFEPDFLPKNPLEIVYGRSGSVSIKIFGDDKDPKDPTGYFIEWAKVGGKVLKTGTTTFDFKNVTFADSGFYTVTVTNKNGMKTTVERFELIVSEDPENLVPITAKDIYTLEIIPPKTDESPTYPTVPDDAKYTLTSKWRLGQSIVTDKFLPKKKYRMELVLQVKPGYTFTNDAHITIGTKEATIVSKVVENPNMSQNCVKLLVEFPMTDAPDNLEQQGFKFRVIPESKTYGDANFIVYTQGGNGDGKIVITSSDPKVLEIVESDPISGMAIIRVKGGGIAKLKATKESGTDGTGVIYNSVTVESNEIKVNPKILIVKAVDKTIKVGTTTTVFPVEITGFVNGDNAQNIQGFVSPTATCTIPVLPKEEEKKTTSKKNTASVSSQTEEEKLEKLLGDYEIIVSGGTPTLAYAFKYVNGSLSLTKSGVQSYPAASQTFLKENSYVIEDRRNGIEITDIVADSYFDAGTELLIKNMTYRLRDDQKALYNANVNAASKDREIALIYDIKLKSNGDFIQPTGDVKVTIDLPHSLKGRYCDLQVAYIDDYGNVTLMPQALGENSISFLTDHFSYYAVVGKLRSAIENTSPNTEVPQTGDNFWCSMVYWFKEKLNIN